jgi:hypothetical protein
MSYWDLSLSLSGPNCGSGGPFLNYTDTVSLKMDHHRTLFQQQSIAASSVSLNSIQFDNVTVFIFIVEFK